MLEFPCAHCGMLLKADDSRRGEKVLCTNCNTRQVVPEDAMPAFETPAVAAITHASGSPAPQPPDYQFVSIIGAIFIVVAMIFAFGDGHQSFINPPESLLLLTGLVSPLGLIAFVSSVHDSRHRRPHLAHPSSDLPLNPRRMQPAPFENPDPQPPTPSSPAAHAAYLRHASCSCHVRSRRPSFQSQVAGPVSGYAACELGGGDQPQPPE